MKKIRRQSKDPGIPKLPKPRSVEHMKLREPQSTEAKDTTKPAGFINIIRDDSSPT